MTVTAPGVVTDMPEATYHADPVEGGSLSQSWAKVLLKPGGPARFHYQQQNPPESRSWFDFGKAAHTEVLGTGSQWVESQFDSFRTKAAQEWRDEQKAQGLTVLSPSDAATVRAMAAALAKHTEVVDLLAGAREVSMFAQDPSTGVWMRGRADTADADGFIDYKTTRSLADADSFSREAARYGYHIQHVWYLTINDLLGRPFGNRFRFVVQEKEPPHLVSVIELDDEFARLGEDEVRRALDLYLQCRDSGQWPGHPLGTVLVSPPSWAYPDIDTDDIELGAA